MRHHLLSLLSNRFSISLLSNRFSISLLSICTAPDETNFLSIYPMADGTDFAQQTRATNVIDDTFIIQEMRLICYNQPIYDDMHVELDEYAGLSLGVRQ